MDASQYCIQEFEVHERANCQDPFSKYTKFINQPFFNEFNGMILHVIDTHSDTCSSFLHWSTNPGSLECCKPRVVNISIWVMSLLELIIHPKFLDTFAEGPFHSLKADHIKNKHHVLVVIECGGTVNNHDAWADLVDLVKE